jgi:hypothetical protein
MRIALVPMIVLIAVLQLPPAPPTGCDAESARCELDANGNCQWLFDCDQRPTSNDDPATTESERPPAN